MTLRQIIRQKRRELDLIERKQAQDKICHLVERHLAIQNASHIGIFLPFDGEVDTLPIIQLLWNQNKSVYLPIIHPFASSHLLFIAYTPKTRLIKNRFGILEPELNVKHILPYQKLDVIFTPLVAFDEQGYRIGMGGGYYDRLLKNYSIQGIYPIGLAFACQKVSELPIKPWDIRLPEIIYA